MSEPSQCRKGAWCAGMERVLNAEANARKKGLSVVIVTDLVTMENETIGVAYRTKSNDRGLMLNACPWCLASLQFWAKDGAS